eukprot:m.100572 g.100572  ORF g.100572 m.100572 type:complete len:70 (+) comp9047_c1_seq1:1018-1227(+)
MVVCALATTIGADDDDNVKKIRKTRSEKERNVDGDLSLSLTSFFLRLCTIAVMSRDCFESSMIKNGGKG